MQVSLTKSRRRRVLTFIATLIAIMLPIIVGKIRGWNSQIFFVTSTFMGIITPFAMDVRIRVTKWWGLLFLQGAIAFWGLYLLHLSTISGRFLTPVSFVCNGMLSLAILFLCQAIFASPKKVGLFWTTFCWFYGLLNTFIYQFRGYVITLNDLHSIQTAINVAANYSPEITAPMIVITYVYICVMATIIRSSIDIPTLKAKKSRLSALALTAIMLIYPFIRLQVTSVQIWGFNGPRKNGVFMEILCELKSMRIKAPEDYSSESVKTISEIYDDEPAEAVPGAAEKNPHIIVVMSESYSDLSVLGAETNREVAPYFKELLPQTLHGYLLSSIYGGNTANSEWELLTGNTMAFMPGGSVPYRQYVGTKPLYSLVDILKEQNYECIAMHPYYSSGWARTKVYPAMGFDKTYFLEDMDWGETVRKYISDEAFTRQIINQFENHASDKSLFLFGISMQNHGSYKEADFESAIALEGLSGKYPQAEQYLGLIHITDNSIRQMIEYFDSVDEKVIILFFGDHQPRLESGLYDELKVENDQLKQLVPFFIWSNYEDLSEEIPLTSINCLSPMLMEIAGLTLPEYFQFILDFQEIVPAINPLGYYYNGELRDIEDIDPEIEELVNNYSVLQFANVFDEEADNAPFTIHDK